MYELNTVFTTADRAHFAHDCKTARVFNENNGATGVLLGEFVSGTGAGNFVWSLRFETLDAVATYIRHGVAMATDPTNELAEVRARYQLVGRSLNRVFNDAGERTGPCLIVTPVTVDKPISNEENKYAVESMVANGAKGASVVVGMDGDSIGLHFVAVYGDTFDQCDAAIAANMNDPRVAAAALDVGVRPVNRLLLDIS